MLYTVDSRDVEKGSLFFALKGAKCDGHDFLQEAKKRGAAGAVIREDYAGGLHNLKVKRVKNVLLELQEMAQKKLAKSNAIRIGITGSVGKTTTTNFLKTLLSEKYKVASTIRNCNGQIGLPLTILNNDLDVDVAVFEMGISEPNEMRRLVEIAPIDYALVTSISANHIEFFGSVEKIAEEKGKIFTSDQLKKGFVTEQALSYFPKCKCITEKGASPFEAGHLSASFFAAAHIARELGLTEEEIARGAKKLKTSPRRFERIEKEGIVFINDSYNASFASFEAALLNLPKSDGRTIGVFGSMGELAENSVPFHRRLGELARDRCDAIYAIGEECRDLLEVFGKEGELFESFEPLFAKVKEVLRPGDLALVKGKNTWKLWRVVDDFA